MMIDDVFVDDYMAFDLETSGLSKWKNDIIQVGAVVVEDQRIEEEISILVNPNYPNHYTVPFDVVDLTGITTRIINDEGTDPAVTIPLMSERLREGMIVTHNGIAFDKGFWEVACRKYDALSPWNGAWLDTAVMFKAMKLGEMVMLSMYETFIDFAKTINRPVRGLKYNLTHCCEDMAVDISDIVLHTASSDSIATHRLFEQMRIDLMGW